MRRRLVTALLAAAVAVAAAAGTARADGDPASDYLLTQQVFLPYDAKIPKDEAARLTSIVRSANRQGFAIRVALIWSDYDLGAVTSLWKQPRRYARFLGTELAFLYKGRLLVVMPNGFGFNWPKHDPAAAYRRLAGISIGDTPGALATAAATAVQTLARAAGVKARASAAAGTTTSPSQSSTNEHDRIVIVVAVIVALLLGALLRLAVRRRAARVR